MQSFGNNNVGDLRNLLMMGRWLPWSFRYSALKPSKDTRIRGGLEKLGGKTENKTNDALNGYRGGFVKGKWNNYSAGYLNIFGTSSGAVVLYGKSVKREDKAGKEQNLSQITDSNTKRSRTGREMWLYWRWIKDRGLLVSTDFFVPHRHSPLPSQWVLNKNKGFHFP